MSQLSEVVLETLKRAYTAYYDVEEIDDGTALKARCDYHIRDSQYVLVKKAELWAAESHEYLYLWDAGELSAGGVEEIFSRPQSEAARRLVLPEGRTVQMTGGRCVRIVFNGSSSFEPVVANLVLECRAPVNILFADTQNVSGQAHGQMVLQLPEDEAAAGRMLRSLAARGITAEEVTGYVE